MRYMLIMRATDEAISAASDTPIEQLLESMGKYNEEMVKAGVLLGGEGLSDASEGVVVDFSAEPPLVTDGPYGETKELFGGFWILEVASKEEAIEWAKRAPLGVGSKLELRRIQETSDFPQDNEWVQKEDGWREEIAQRQK